MIRDRLENSVICAIPTWHGVRQQDIPARRVRSPQVRVRGPVGHRQGHCGKPGSVQRVADASRSDDGRLPREEDAEDQQEFQQALLADGEARHERSGGHAHTRRYRKDKRLFSRKPTPPSPLPPTRQPSNCPPSRAIAQDSRCSPALNLLPSGHRSSDARRRRANACQPPCPRCTHAPCARSMHSQVARSTAGGARPPPSLPSLARAPGFARSAPAPRCWQ